MSPITTDQAEDRFLEVVLPEQANHCGALHGANALQMMGKAAFTCAMRHARCAVVMAKADSIELVRPIRIGSPVDIRARVVFQGRSSMTVIVEVSPDSPGVQEGTPSITGRFLMVAVDSGGVPIPILPSDSQTRRGSPPVKQHKVRTYRSAEKLAREDQLAWKIASVAADDVPLDAAVVEMIGNRIIDNAAVAAASLARRPVVNARAQAQAHPFLPGATVFGLPVAARISPEWAAWANGVAVRELDFHDTFLAADYSHPGDNIPPILAVAQHCGLSGAQLAKGLATGYEIQVNLVKGICLHEHKIDHIAHLGPSAAASIGTALGLPVETIYQAVQQALHVTTTTRQSRKGEISSWKAYAPAFAGKMAVEAVDRVMRGEGAPSPAWEGEDGFIAYLLGGPKAEYIVPLPEKGETKRAILDTYTKEHSAEYQSQALIDLARRMGPKIGDLSRVKDIVIHTSHHTHYVIGTGANDPQKMDPKASRETLDHSIMYIFAVALEDRGWHHERSYAPERANRPETVALWHKISTVEDPDWTRRYHSHDPKEKAFGGQVVVTLQDGSVMEDELAVADAHPLGARPFARPDYVKKFRTLSEGIVAAAEQDRFIATVERLTDLAPQELAGLTFTVDAGRLGAATASGIFDWKRD